jgi:hypothetical protein
VAQHRDYRKLHDRQSLDRESIRSAQDCQSNAYSYRMPFGRYNGRQIVAVPTDYLEYCRAQSNNLATVKRCADELERRYSIRRGIGRQA